MSKKYLWDSTSILQEIQLTHQDLLKTIEALPEYDFEFSWNGKWTPGQQLLHITQSIRPITLAFRLPRFFAAKLFGQANRPSRPYADVVSKYQKALQGVTQAAPKQFQPKALAFSSRAKAFKAYNEAVEALVNKTQKCSEKDLDRYVLPHPLVGKLTFREMLFFTIYHVQHHHRITKEIIVNIPSNS